MFVVSPEIRQSEVGDEYVDGNDDQEIANASSQPLKIGEELQRDIRKMGSTGNTIHFL